MSDNGFIFLLSFGAALLAGILTVAHVSAYRLNQRRQLRQSATEPELELGDVPRISIEARRQPEAVR